jgi:hypothetical protein
MLLIILQALTLAACVAILALRGFLPKYVEEKAKNLATKEDIEGITASIERVRSQHAAELERVRSDLNRALNVHKLQYETELRTYEQIWIDLVDVQRAALSLRPIVDTLPQDESEKQRVIQKRLETFGEAFNRFVARVHSRRPFYPPEVFAELNELLRLAHGEAIDVQWGDKHDAGYWKDAKRNAEAISAQVDKVCEAVRRRLGSAGAA